MFVPESEGGAAERIAQAMRESCEGDVAARFLEMMYATDVTDLLAHVDVPTLVLNRQHDRGVPFRMARELASCLPNARLVSLDGMIHLFWYGNWGPFVAAVDEFLQEERSQTLQEPLPSGTAIILFADIVDSTALTERLGDDAIRENGGSPVEGKTLGDGVLAVFTSAKQAIACAQACHDAARRDDLALHVGIHAGDVIHEADPDGRGNVYGGAVNIAARVAAAAAAGETLVSGTVRDLARTSAGVTFEDRGEQSLKGIDDPVRLFAVSV